MEICHTTWTDARLTSADRLLRGLARRQWPSNGGGLQDDLVQAAWLRLVTESFNPSLGVPFEGWLIQRAKWAMADAQRSQGWLRQHRGSMRTSEPQMLSLDEARTMTAPKPAAHDPLLAQRIRGAFHELPPRLRGFLLATTRVGGRKAHAQREGVCSARGSQLAQKAVTLFRDALSVRGVRP